MKFRNLIWLILVFLPMAHGGEKVVIPSMTPVFAEPSRHSRLINVSAQPTEAELIDTKRFLEEVHPLAYYWYFSQVRLPDGQTGYFEPQIRVGFDENEKAVLEFNLTTPWWRLLLMGVIGAALAVNLILLYRHYHKKSLLSPRAFQCCLILTIVLVRQILLAMLIHGGGNIITRPADDTGYFENLHSFLTWDFSKPWHFTVGQSILYLPLTLLTGAQTIYDILIPYSYFSGFVLAPLSLAAGYLIARKLTGSTVAAFASMAAWAILPFFYYYNPDFTSPDGLLSSFFALPDFGFNFFHYTVLIATGFNAMSDTASTLFILGCLVMALYLKPGPRNYALIAFVFAFSCMLRINNILFLPPIALVIWLNGGRGELLKSWRHFLLCAGAAAGAFVVGFLPQFAANAYFYGSPLLFSYIRCDAGAHTYLAWNFVNFNSCYYAGSSYLIWVPAVLSLWFMKSRELRTIFCWWAIPVIFFFYGYSHGWDDPVRFVLTSFPAFFMAITACEVWRGLNKYERWCPVVFAAGWLLLLPNPSVAVWQYYLEDFRFFHRFIEYTWLNWIIYAAMLGALWGLRKKPKLACFLALSTFLYLYGNAYLLNLLMAGAMLRALWDSIGLVQKATLPANPLEIPE